MVEGTPLDSAGRDEALKAALSAFPDAVIGAISPATMLVPLPDGIAVEGQRTIRGQASALSLIARDDHPAAGEAWQLVASHGVADFAFHPATDRRRVIHMYLVDAVERHGVVIMIIDGLAGAESLLDHEPVRPRLGVLHKSIDAVITSADEAAATLLGRPAESLVGVAAIDLVHPDDHHIAVACWMDLHSAPLGTVRRIRQRYRHHDGRALWFETTSRIVAGDGEEPYVVAEMIDITEEMAAQEALRASEQRLRRLTESLPIGVLQLDRAARVIYQNQRIARALGTTGGDVLGEEHLRLVVPADRAVVGATLRSVLATGGDADVEYGYHDRRLGLRRVVSHCRGLTGDDGEVTGVIISILDITADARLRDELHERATYDDLTGCLNRAALLDAVQRELSTATRGTAVVFVDLDEFKQVNDRLGHAAGDRLLTFVGQRLRAAAGPGAVVGRFGGDEFVVLCRDVPGLVPARQTADHLAAAIAATPLELGAARVRPGASIGVAFAAPGAADADTLIGHADSAMYRMKRERRRVLLHD